MQNQGIFTCFIFLLCFWLTNLWSQEIKIYTTADYSLHGPVKNCLVLTNYGQEEFAFDREGKLTKVVTRFNEKDYTISSYKYKGGELVERRDEVYRDGKFEKATSMAHFFEYDTVPDQRVKEQIVNYNKELLDRYEYFFDGQGKIERIVRSSPEGVDETRIEREENEGETTTSYFLNEVLQTTVTESEVPANDGSQHRIVHTRDYINNLPDKASEATYNSQGDLISEVLLEYRKSEKTFVPVSSTTYKYDDKGVLQSTKNESGNRVEENKYIFQFDTRGNWTKQIITPENAYTTRKISYYPAEVTEDTGG